MENPLTLHLLLSGRVQGVYFRKFTREQADAFGVLGYVRNLPNGRVEAVLSGEAECVRRMEQELKVGPPNASVTEVASAEVSFHPFDRFEVRR